MFLVLSIKYTKKYHQTNKLNASSKNKPNQMLTLFGSIQFVRGGVLNLDITSLMWGWIRSGQRLKSFPTWTALGSWWGNLEVGIYVMHYNWAACCTQHILNYL